MNYVMIQGPKFKPKKEQRTAVLIGDEVIGTHPGLVAVVKAQVKEAVDQGLEPEDAFESPFASYAVSYGKLTPKVEAKLRKEYSRS